MLKIINKMTLTALFRDFLIKNKIKQKFEKNFLAMHPEFKTEDGRFDWSNDRYAKYILSHTTSVGNPLNPALLIGVNCAQTTFYWDRTDEGDNFWWSYAKEWILYSSEHVINNATKGLPHTEKS